MRTQPKNGRILSVFAAIAVAALATPSVWAISAAAAYTAAYTDISGLITSSTSVASFALQSGTTVDALVKANTTSIGVETAYVKGALAAISDFAVGNLVLTTATLNAQTVLQGAAGIGTALANDTALQNQLRPANALITILSGGLAGITGSRGNSQLSAPMLAGDFVEGIVTGTAPGVSGTVPAVTGTSFAVGILKSVATNANVDEFVTYQVALVSGSALSTSLGDALYKKYPRAVAKITQGIMDATTSGTGEPNRTALLTALIGSTPTEYRNAPAILEGAIFTDPFYSGSFTTAAFNAIQANKSAAQVATDAAGIATGLGEILGQDGYVLTQVATAFCKAMGTGEPLTASNAATYAKDLIAGAVAGYPNPISAHQNNFSVITGTTSYLPPGVSSDGGKLVLGNGRNGAPTAGFTIQSAPTVKDLESIIDQFATAIVNADGVDSAGVTTKDATAAATQIGTLAEDVAKFTKGENFVPTSDMGVPAVDVSTEVENFLAGSLAQTIVDLNLTGTVTIGRTSETVGQLILADVEKDLKLVSTADAPGMEGVLSAVETAGTSAQTYTTYSVAFNQIETPITNQ